MPLSRRVAESNRKYLNRLSIRVTGRLPGFGIVGHVGRRSGRLYRTPINVFRRGDGYRIGLTYGDRAEWVRNVLAAGECTLTTRGRTLRLVDPVVITDPSRRSFPLPVRFVLGRIHAVQYLQLRIAPEPQDGSGLDPSQLHE